MAANHRTADIPTHRRSRAGRLTTLAASLREGTTAARAAADRAAIRGQLGPSVGRRHDRFPERFL